MLQLQSIEYRERGVSGSEWKLCRAQLSTTNLIVGKNAAGKTRVVNVIYSIASLFQDKVKPLWNSGIFRLELAGSDGVYCYDVDVQQKKVMSEKLVVDGNTRISRDSRGVGQIWSEKLGQNLDFQIADDAVAAVTKRDSIQHPYLESIHQWARSVRRYPFGSQLGKTNVYAHDLSNEGDDSPSETTLPASDDPDQVTHLYLAGWERFGEVFDQAILADMAAVGYDCTEISADDAAQIGLPKFARAIPVMLHVQERDLPFPTWQHEMSVGMYRALAIIIHMNFSIKTGSASCVLIDDIGEGLDFDRSTNLIKLIIEKSKVDDFQLILTTNDRFVMNEVPLEYWHIIDRQGPVVRLLDKVSNPKMFEEFEFLGVNNFDFFRLGLYSEAASEENGDIR